MTRRGTRPRRRTASVAAALVFSSALVGARAADADTRTICFPVAERDQVELTNSFGDERGGGSRSHEGEDMMGQKMFHVLAPVDGVIVEARWDASGPNVKDNLLTLRGDDGVYYVFLHMNDDTPGTDDGRAARQYAFAPGIDSGVRVEAGQHLGYMGDSGNAENTRAHLHFEMRAGTSWSASPFDPYPSLLDAATCGAGATPALGARGVKAVIPGDFDGDGLGELFAYAPGPAADALFTGTPQRTLAPLTVTNVSGDYVPLAGDFDGDGRTDILWYGPGTTAESIWYGTTTAGHFSIGGAPVANGNYAPIVGDFDGDGRTDVLWYAPGPSGDFVWYGSGQRGTFVSHPAVANGDYRPAAGDFDGDGIDDIIWHGPGTSPDYEWYGSGERGRFASVPRVSNGDYEPFAGDFDGDGIDDIFWYAPGAPSDFLWYGAASRHEYTSVNRNVGGAYAPEVIDLDGDGRDDVFWWSRGFTPTPTWYGDPTPGRFSDLRI